MDSGFVQYLFCSRAGHANCAQRGAYVRYFHVVHDDELVEMRQNNFAQPRVNIHEQHVAHVVGIEVGLDVSLRIQQECIDAVVEGKITDIIRHQRTRSAPVRRIFERPLSS